MIGQCYDSLGILGPFLLPARKTLPEACRLGIAWNEHFSVRGLGDKEWDRFMQALPSLEYLTLATRFTVLGVQAKCILNCMFSVTLRPVVVVLVRMFALCMKIV